MKTKNMAESSLMSSPKRYPLPIDSGFTFVPYQISLGWLGLLIAVMLALSPTKLPAQSFETVTLQEVSEFLDKVQTYRKSYSNYQVQFRERRGKGLLIGDLYFAKPQQMRITYRRGNRVVTEVFLGPEKLIVYYVGSAIVYEQENLNNVVGDVAIPGSLDYLMESYNFNFIAKNPVEVLTGEDYRLFNFTRPPQVLSYHLKLTPKDITRGLDNLEIWFLAQKNPGNQGEFSPTQVIRSRLSNKDESLSDIYYLKVEVNQKFPVDIFNFVIPAHVRIVKNYFSSLDEIKLEEN